MPTTELMRIQPFIQAYVLAIASILDAEVTVVDSNLIRVGGTGSYAGQSGKKIADSSFFADMLSTGQPGLIRDAREEATCARCEKRADCRELANLAYPIFLDGRVVGIIGMVAFKPAEQERLLRDSKKLEEFLKYMSMLIESKIMTERGKASLERQLRAVITADPLHIRAQHFVGEDPAILAILDLVNKVSRSDSTICITGESGTGKEVLAQIIHAQSPRRDRLMISVNCGAIPETLVESELFGYAEGAFTGAKKHGHTGKFELADNSTLLLDEVSELPPAAQTTLLRVLQERTIERIGGKQPVPVNVRVICATNRDLESMVEQGEFRRDLYYRLNVIPIHLPPLRARRADIPLLIRHFMARYNQILKKNIRALDAETEALLVNYNWPGNIRELRNIIEYLGNVVDGDTIQAADLPGRVIAHTTNLHAGHTLAEMMRGYEKHILARACAGLPRRTDKRVLAQQLGLSRATLYRKLAGHNLLD